MAFAARPWKRCHNELHMVQQGSSSVRRLSYVSLYAWLGTQGAGICQRSQTYSCFQRWSVGLFRTSDSQWGRLLSLVATCQSLGMAKNVAVGFCFGRHRPWQNLHNRYFRRCLWHSTPCLVLCRLSGGRRSHGGRWAFEECSCRKSCQYSFLSSHRRSRFRLLS